MKHAVLGAGAVGGLLAGLFASHADEVLLILRPETLANHPGEVTVTAPSETVIGSVHLTDRLSESVDALWISTKANQLKQALSKIEANPPAPIIVPVLNGIDHVPYLRNVYGCAIAPATIFVEAERTQPGNVIQHSVHRKLSISGKGRQVRKLVQRLNRFGFECQLMDDELTMMWQKLCFLAPFALTTSAADKTCGEVLSDPKWAELLHEAIRETCSVAIAEGARVSEQEVTDKFLSAPAGMRSSMQRDLRAGLAPELDAIAGPIIRGSSEHHTESSACRYLVSVIEECLTTGHSNGGTR